MFHEPGSELNDLISAWFVLTHPRRGPMTDLAVKDPTIVDGLVRAVPPPPTRERNPGLLALPLVIAGGFCLGFTNTGIVDVAAAAVPILLSATAVGLLLATVWAAALRQNVNATVYGVFFGFYASYAVLSLGLTHDWFGIPAADAGQTTLLGQRQLTSGRSQAGTRRCCPPPPRRGSRARRR